MTTIRTTAGAASEVTLGLAVSVGCIVSPAIGALADQTTLQLALIPLIALPMLGWLFLRRLRDPRIEPWARRRPREP